MKKIFIWVFSFMLTGPVIGQDCFTQRLDAAIKSYNEKKYDDAIAQLESIKKLCEKFDVARINEWKAKAEKKKKELQDSDKDGFPNNRDKCPSVYSNTNNGCPLPTASFSGFTKMEYVGGTYEGYYLRGKFDGRGKYVTDIGDVYIGNFKEGVYEGQGKMIYRNGDTYIGSWKDGARHGYGSLMLTDGDSYDGFFKEDKFDGQGTYNFSDNRKYAGGWKKGAKEGFGIFTWPNGDYYEGNFENDKYHGKGTFVFSDRRKYTGDWKNGLEEGRGIFAWPNGDRYEGNFSQNTINGEGTYYYANGDKYVGSFKDGKREGYGNMTWTDGDKYEGIFRDNKQLKRNEPGKGLTGFKDLLKENENCAFLEYYGTITAADIQEYYKKNRKLNLQPYAVFKLKSKYYAVWVEEDAENSFFSFDSPSYPSDSIQRYFDRGYNISFLEKIDGLWYLNMIRYKNDFEQATRTYPKTSFQDSIKAYAAKGYSVQNIIDIGDNFKFLLSKFKDDKVYEFTQFTNDKDYDAWVTEKQKYSKINYLYCWKLVGGKFFYFMDYFENVSTWSLMNFDGTNMAGISKKINEGFFIDNITVDYGVKITLRKNN